MDKLKILNCCPHDVSVYEGAIFDPATNTYRGGSCIRTFPSSGYLASAKSSVSTVEPMELEDAKIPICRREFVRVTELPGNADYYIVSSLYAQASKELNGTDSNLLVPYGTVVDNTGKKLGCVALIHNAETNKIA